MKSIDNIPISKLERSAELFKTGVKVGGNYLKYYGKKALQAKVDKDELDQNNADDIYNGLKNLKGSALKVAQMLSMEKNILPQAYVDQFSLSQFSVPPLSPPLVRKTFKRYHGQYPEELYDTFATQSINAASIGQVHKARKDGKELAVKIQYPGVADSIGSDLAMVKPIAVRMFNLKGKDYDKYFKEVEQKLLEETNYELELEQSEKIAKACAKISNLRFPKYYKELSSQRVITMDWMTGLHLSEFAKQDHDQEVRNQVGQTLWDFYMYQIHALKEVHADPHPGNFLVDDDYNLIAIDFGCIKRIPSEFYDPYFELADHSVLNDNQQFKEKMFALEILKKEDSENEIKFFSELFKEMLTLFTKPFNEDLFNFADNVFWNNVSELSKKYAKDTELRKMNGNRGSKHFLYMNRTFFGLYNLLHDLKACVRVRNFERYL